MIEVKEAPVQIPQEPTTPIKPSEALRLGRLLAPRQTAGVLSDGAGGACAIGAMLIGWGDMDPSFNFFADAGKFSSSYYGAFRKRVPGMSTSSVYSLFDFEASRGRDGDGPVLRFLEAQGL